MRILLRTFSWIIVGAVTIGWIDNALTLDRKSDEWEVSQGWIHEGIIGNFLDNRQLQFQYLPNKDLSFNSTSKSGDQILVTDEQSKLVTTINGKTAEIQMHKEKEDIGFAITHGDVTVHIGYSDQEVRLQFSEPEGGPSQEIRADFAKFNEELKKENPEFLNRFRTLAVEDKRHSVDGAGTFPKRAHVYFEFDGLQILILYHHWTWFKNIYLDGLEIQFSESREVELINYDPWVSVYEKYRALNKDTYYDWVPLSIRLKDREGDVEWAPYLKLPSPDDIEIEGKGIVLRQFNHRIGALEITSPKFVFRILLPEEYPSLKKARNDFLFKLLDRDYLCEENCVIEAESIEEFHGLVGSKKVNVRLDAENHLSVEFADLKFNVLFKREHRLSRYLKTLKINGVTPGQLVIECQDAEGYRRSEVSNIYIQKDAS